MDIETFTDKNNEIIPYCICCIIENQIYTFWYDKNIIIIFLEKIVSLLKKKKIDIFVHNINFDGYVLINFFKKTNVRFDWFIRDFNIYWIKIFFLKKEIFIRCSYKIIPLSVDSLSKTTNFKKLIFPHKFVSLATLDYKGQIPSSDYFESKEDYNNFKKKHLIFNLRETVIEYCSNDVRIVHEVLINIIGILNVYNKKLIAHSYSFSSIAYKMFTFQFDNYKITKLKTYKTHSLYFRNGYYGGRCEVFGNPSKDELIHYFDFKGMYASCMLEKYPLGKPVFKEKNLNVTKIGFHTIKFKCDSYLPFLPIKSQKLYFPNGTMTGTYWYEEILNALAYKKCEIIEHYSSIEFDQEDFIFKNYVEFFTKIREKGVYFNLFGKNMINGLYGSFALQEENHFTIVLQSEEEFNSICNLTDVVKWKKIGNLYIINIEKNQKSRFLFKTSKKFNDLSESRNVMYAAIISSKARVKLNKALQKTLDCGGKLYYTDTDSIFAGFSSSFLGEEMGEIRWSEILEDAVFLSSKFYFIKNKNLKLKGIKTNNYDFEDVKKNFFNGEFFLKWDGQFNVNKKDYNFFYNYNSKIINLCAYDKRIFDKNKKNTKPVVIT